jgi:hypothetical protein
VASLRTFRTWFLWLFCIAVLSPALRAATATEDQLKAVFLFNFSHFVAWPAETFSSPTEPFVIGVLGSEALASQLEAAVQGEQVGTHPLQVRRFASVEELGDCEILFIGQSEAPRLDSVLQRIAARGTLTVSDLDNASRRGVMIQFAKENNRIRLLVNVDSAKGAGLTISSNLLRPASIVRTGE